MNNFSTFIHITSVCCLFVFSTRHTDITWPNYLTMSSAHLEPRGFPQDSIVKDFDTSPVFPGCNDLETIEERERCSFNKLLMFLFGELDYPVQARKIKWKVLGSFRMS